MYEKLNNSKNIENIKEDEEKITPLKKEIENQTNKIDNENKDNIIKEVTIENKELNKIEDNVLLINQLLDKAEKAKENYNNLKNELNTSKNKLKIIKKEMSEQLHKYYSNLFKKSLSEYTEKINNKIEEIEKNILRNIEKKK